MLAHLVIVAARLVEELASDNGPTPAAQWDCEAAITAAEQVIDR